VTDTRLRPLDFTAPYLDDPVEFRLGPGARIGSWLAVHGRSLTLLAVLLPFVAVLHGRNMYRYPGITVNDDEGTYVAQAWAVGAWHQLAHYTYWYDHPPLGWIQIAAYGWLTGAWSRAPYSMAVGREFMLAVDVLACALLFLLARRLSFSRWAAAAAVVLFAVAPVALHFHRMVFLDNIEVMWIIAALALAASPRRSLGSAVGSAICLSAAVLTKETAALLAPFVWYVLWQHSDVRTRRYRMAAFSTLAGVLVLFYPLYALLKNELFEGPGHVSLLWAVRWQLMLRESSGSILEAGSSAEHTFHGWIDLDPWLLGTGLVLAAPALAVRWLRPPALALALQAVLALRPGYLPQAYIVALLPFAALVISGCANQLACLHLPRLTTRPARALLALPIVVGAVAVAPIWARGDAAQLAGGSNPQTAEAMAWIMKNIGHDQNMAVDDNVWLDLVRAGYEPTRPRWSVIWFWKLGRDPSVRIPPGLDGIDYFVYAMDPIYGSRETPQIIEPYRHSRIIATFGSGDNRITVRKVIR
jgi:4-amino-4-deoxy-L-arabinose transferase-like glycosyltransferase